LEKNLTILQLQNELNFYKRKLEKNVNEDLKDTCLWFHDRLDLALNNSFGETERAPYGPEGDRDKFQACRATIPYGPARTPNNRGMNKILFIGKPQTGIEEIFKLCQNIGNPQPVYLTPTSTLESLEILNVSLIFFPITEENLITQKPLIQSFYSSTEGIVFVINLEQPLQIEEIGKIIKELLNDENDEIKVPKVPVLILVNKKAKDVQCTTADVKKKLNIAKFENRELNNVHNDEGSDENGNSDNVKFHIQLCNIHDNEGLYEGMDWIAENMKKGKEAVEVIHASGCVVQ